MASRHPGESPPGLSPIDLVTPDMQRSAYDILQHPQFTPQRFDFESHPDDLFAVICGYNAAFGAWRPPGQGRSLGGNRLYEIADLKLSSNADPELVDKAARLLALRLGRAMTFKYIMLNYALNELARRGLVTADEVNATRRGGSKAVGVVRNVQKFHADSSERHRNHFSQYARFLTNLAVPDLFTIAVDMNTSPQYMDYIYDALYKLGKPGLVACQTEAKGGHGDPSQTTAAGVRAILNVAVGLLGVDPKDIAIILQGAGHVGEPQLYSLRYDYPDAKILVAEKDDVRARGVIANTQALAGTGEVIRIDHTNLFSLENKRQMDGRPLVFVPSAGEEVIDWRFVEEFTLMNGILICGPANEQGALDEEGQTDIRIFDELNNRKVLSVVDFFANSGGILDVELLLTGNTRERAQDLISLVMQVVGRQLLLDAIENHISPHEVIFDRATRWYAAYHTQHSLPL